MGPLVFLMAAYAVIWLLIFLFVYAIYRRQQRLRRELEMLEQLVAGNEND